MPTIKNVVICMLGLSSEDERTASSRLEELSRLSAGGMHPYVRLIVDAVQNKNISGRIQFKANGHEVDLEKSTVGLMTLNHYLKQIEVHDLYFNRKVQTDAHPEYLDKSSPFYSAKLALAVEAWKAVSSEQQWLYVSKNPK